MTSPCLCGDPACGRCFPGNQARMTCVDEVNCKWTGKRYDCGECEDENGEDTTERMIATCPACGCECREVEEGYGHGV